MQVAEGEGERVKRWHGFELLTVREVAEFLGCSDETVLRRIRDGLLPAVRLTKRCVRIRDYDLRDYVGT